GRDGLLRLRETVRGLVDNDGITYNEIDQDPHDVAMPGQWQLDAIPLLVSASDWDTLEAGMVQRARLLDAVLTDVYGERRAVTSGILPPQLLFGHPGYIRAARGVQNPGRHQLFMLGCDVSRAGDGRFLVNADRTQAPSGAGYALADRRVVARAIPDIYERIGPRPASPFAQSLRLALIDVAPATAEDPVVVVLSPGIHSETAFDQAYLATVLGFPLVESADLVVRDGKLWMRSLGTLKRVDVVLRRVDAAYSDPLDLRPDSRLGVVGLVEVQRRGAVTVVNTLGSGIMESPGVQRFFPELARTLFGEEPALASPQLYWAGLDSERSHILARLSCLVIKSAVAEETFVGPALSAAELQQLASRIQAQPWQWVGQELPQFSSAPTDHFPGGLSAASVGMRLFAVSQRSGYSAMVGGLGYVLAQGPSAFNLRSVAAKDIWVRQQSRVGAEQSAVTPTMELPSGTQFISSPRVLSDLFWIGRYAERAEGTARLLAATRERYHEYNRRHDVAGSECVPVLLDALRQITGVADAPQTLWSLTVDRLCPGSLAHSVERLALAARAVRDQMSNDTWMVLTAVERALEHAAQSAPSAGDDTLLANAQRRTLAGMLALSGMTSESMVHDAGWTMMDVGKRIERGLMLTDLLRATLTVSRSAEAERTVTETVLLACESSVIYRRLNLGRVSVEAVADLVLFDEKNPRSLIFQLDRLRENLRSLSGSSGSSKAERVVEEITARLRRSDPADLEELDDSGRRVALDELLAGVHGALSELAEVITATQLSLPGDMQPLWGPDQSRLLP
ncbi:MAG: circularly permuted type 2 ATP-grasp protein, partial [Mycobacterium sp.]